MPYLLESKKEEIKILIEQGFTYIEIANVYNTHKETVARLVRYYKYSHINLEYFDVIDTETKAYLLGFILADGSLYKVTGYNSLILDIGVNSRDREVVELIRDEISPSHKIYDKVIEDKNFKKKESCLKSVITIGCTKLCKKLIEKYKFSLDKSHDINYEFPFDTIPKELHRHFIRGFFDGDGHIGMNNCKYFQKRKNILIQYHRISRIGFTSCHIKFLNQLIIHLPKVNNPRIYTRDMYTNNLHFTINQKNHREFYDFFYKDSTKFLSRKHNSFLLGLDNTEVTI